MRNPEEKWVRQAKAGSSQAFDRLMKRYMKPIFQLLYDMTGNAQDAEDLTQECFLKAYRNLSSYRGNAQFFTWIYRIAANAGLDYLKHKKRVRHVDIADQNPARFSGEGGAHTPAEQHEARDAIGAALSKLPETQRTAVILFHQQGFKMREIGDILGCSEGTARVHVFRGVRRLRDLLKPFVAEG